MQKLEKSFAWRKELLEALQGLLGAAVGEENASAMLWQTVSEVQLAARCNSPYFALSPGTQLDSSRASNEGPRFRRTAGVSNQQRQVVVSPTVFRLLFISFYFMKPMIVDDNDM